jgi:uncharacterized membrane protein
MRRTLSIRRVIPWATWAYVLVALVLGWVVPRIEAPWLGVSPTGDEKIIQFLGAVSGGMMAFTGIIFALLFVLLQFASTAYTPHVVPILTRQAILKHAAGVFTGTFLYSLMALRGVGSLGGATPSIVVWTAFAWLLVSVYLLLRLIRVFTSLGVSDVLDMLGEAAHRGIDQLYGSRVDGAADAPPPGRIVQTIEHHGPLRYVVALDVPRLVALAHASGAILRLPVALGDSVVPGACLATVEGSAVREADVCGAITLAPDRTFEQGPKHALRLLVDIAIRALSPAINDPTTAVHALDQIEAILRRLGSSELDIGCVRDASGAVRLVYPTATWEDYLALGVTEIQLYGAGAVQIERRLAALFRLLRDTVLPVRRAAVDAAFRERTARIRESFPRGALRDAAEGADRQGIGGHPPLLPSEA